MNNIYRFFVGAITFFVKSLPDDYLSRAIRRNTYRLLGAKIGNNTNILADCQVFGNNLIIGNDVFINRSCYLDSSGPLIIGNKVTIGHGTSLITASHDHSNSTKRAGKVIIGTIRIGDGAWIAANCTILPNIEIAHGCVIGAGSIVTKNTMPNCMYIGAPAKLVKQLP